MFWVCREQCGLCTLNGWSINPLCQICSHVYRHIFTFYSKQNYRYICFCTYLVLIYVRVYLLWSNHFLSFYTHTGLICKCFFYWVLLSGKIYFFKLYFFIRTLHEYISTVIVVCVVFFVNKTLSCRKRKYIT